MCTLSIATVTAGPASPADPAGPVPGLGDDPDWPAILEYLTGHYGTSPYTWGDVIYYRLRPHWMVAFAASPADQP